MFKNFRVILRITPRDIMRFIKASGRFVRNLLPALVFSSILLLNSSVEVFASSGGFVTDKNPSSGTVYNGNYTKYYSQSEALKEFEYDDHMFLHLYEYLARYSEYYSVPDLDSALPVVSDFLRSLALHFQCTGSFNPPLVVKPMSLSGLRLISYDYSLDQPHNSELYNLFYKLCPVKIGDRYLCYLKDNIFYFLLEDDDIFCVTPDCMAGFVSSGDFILGSSTLKNEVIPALNNQYTPKNFTGKISYRTDERWHKKFGSTNNSYWELMEIYSGKYGFAPVGGGSDMYVILFFHQGSDTYYGKYQLHFKVTSQDVWYEDRDEIEYTGYTLTCEFWDMVNGSFDLAQTVTVCENADFPYFTFCGSSNSLSPPLIYGYSSYSDFTDYANPVEFDPFHRLFPDNDFSVCYSSDLQQSLNIGGGFTHFRGSLSNHDSSCSEYGSEHDIGYVASSTPISTIYNIDTSKIPDDYVITVKGDTVYDYSITNPVTGDTTTIDKFVINNYNFPGNGNGNGGTSGDITVGGKIDVSGTVSVDVNVDVNISGAGGGGGKNYSMPDTGFFDSYLDDALEESSGIRKFIEDFFSSVPGEITKLICIGLVLAILCRLIGR